MILFSQIKSNCQQNQPSAKVVPPTKWKHVSEPGHLHQHND